MNIIYKPHGRAGEYADLAANLYSGCACGCAYCYVPGILRLSRNTFSTQSRPRTNLYALLERDCFALVKRFAPVRPPAILLCFSCDPYQPQESNRGITRATIHLFKDFGLRFTVLTKCGSLATRDFDLYEPGDSYGVSLTCRDNNDSARIEPFADGPDLRLASLQSAAAKGIDTWASMEPVLDPEQSLDLIKMSLPYVNTYKLGRLNHAQGPNAVDWALYLAEASLLLAKHGKQFLVKQDLADSALKGLKALNA